jgi:pimeloyl-ACP methyl ester carboxylesterase
MYPNAATTTPMLLLLAMASAGCGPARAADVDPAARRLGEMRFDSCTLAAEGLPITVAAYCGRLVVPEDRSRPDGRSIELAVALVPSRSKQPRPDPVFMLAGGPGQAAREAFPQAVGAFRDVLRERHVVLVDQRGTGGSHSLECPAPDEADGGSLTELADPAGARRLAERCLAGLDADPRWYTTSDAVLDLEAVREAIGAAQVNLVGISYGTRVALEYLRRYPQHTRSVVLDGVVPPELALGADHARNLEAALDRHFAACEADAECRALYGPPRAQLERLLASLETKPLHVRYRDPVTDKVREEDLTSAAVAGVVRLYSYTPQLAAMLPRTLAEANAGRPEALMAQARMIEVLIGEQISLGPQLSVSCAEDADRLRVNPADEGTLLGTGFVEALLAQCEVWPRGRRPADFNEPVVSDHAVLLLSGELDPVTPPRYGEDVVKHLANGRHLVAPGQGHNVMASGCAPRLMARFIDQGSARALDVGCLDRLSAPPPFLGAFGWGP